MPKIKILNLKGEAVKDMVLSDAVFARKENAKLVSEAVRIERANLRQSIAHTKTRGEVSGGGRKPFKQKGTGNARAGSTRSPLWIGGGITFGPRNERNFKLRMPQTMKQNAIKTVLSEKVSNNKFIIVSDLALKEISTKKFLAVLEQLPIEEGKILIVIEQINPELELSSANVPFVKVIKAENINMLDIAKYDYMVLTEAAAAKINETLGK